MDKERTKIINKLKEFKQKAKEFEIEKILFFGSRATGKYKKIMIST